MDNALGYRWNCSVPIEMNCVRTLEPGPKLLCEMRGFSKEQPVGSALFNLARSALPVAVIHALARPCSLDEAMLLAYGRAADESDRAWRARE